MSDNKPAPGLVEALPCPFCGAKAEWHHHSKRSNPAFTNGVEHVWEWQSSISCPQCRLAFCSGFGNTLWEGGNALAHQYAMKEALKKWNRRAALSQPVPSAPEPSDAEGWMSRKDAEATAECLIAEGMAKIEEAERVAAVNAETVSRLHHALARHGWHPGRTDEPIADCVEKALAAGPADPYPNKRAAPPVPAAAPAVEPTDEELSEVRALRAERAERQRTAGRFVLTAEGREQAREIFGDDPTSWVTALLDEVERLERLATLPASPEPAAAPAVEPVAWGIFDSQGFYEAAIDEETAKRFCTHYNKRSKDDPLRPYSFRPLFASPEPAAQGAAKPVHTDHPFQHWDRTCPACVLEASPPVPNSATQGAAIQIRQADERGDDALRRAHKLEEALEYLFLAIVTRADSDYLFRAVNRADEALRYSMPGWTPPVPMTGWASPAPEPLTPAAGLSDEVVAKALAAALASPSTHECFWCDGIGSVKRNPGGPMRCIHCEGTGGQRGPALPAEKQGD